MEMKAAIPVDAAAFEKACNKVYRFGFEWLHTLHHPDTTATGRVFQHPQTKALINMYPDGTFDRDSFGFRDGWFSPAIEQAKAALEAEKQRAPARLMAGMLKASVGTLTASEKRQLRLDAKLLDFKLDI